jgi:hypothetical protein
MGKVSSEVKVFHFVSDCGEVGTGRVRWGRWEGGGRWAEEIISLSEFRGGIHRRIVTQKTKSFALTYSQSRIYLVFCPTRGFPNTWFSSPQFGGFFCIFSSA